MLIKEWSPPTKPNRDEQRDALKKGLGRAWIWAMRGRLEVDPQLLGLFLRNFEPGDEERILEALILPENDDGRHSLLRDALTMLESQPKASCYELAILIYHETPCSLCRACAAQLLSEDERTPDHIMWECQFDACGKSRKLGLASGID